MSHTKRILITADPQEVRVAIVEGGKLSEAYIERRGRRSIVGNIYLGRVDAVLPGMEAAFVDVGLEKNGFLYVNEIVTPELDDRERRKKQISDLLRPGQEILVQATKDPMKTKGARLTMDVSLAGRFMVLAPNGDGVGVSKRLGDGERDRLRDLIRRVKTQEDAGLIVRTAAEGATIQELERDVRLLEKLWETTRGHAQRSQAPALVYVEPDLSLQMIRDDLRSDVSEVVIDDERQFHRIASYVRRTSPELLDRVKQYRGKRALFQRYEIDQGIRSTLRKRVDLPSGGYLIFDYAEAFTIVDVNTGRFTGKSRKLEDTIVKTNLEAAVELVRQLRLRDIGGIIVVDFIDMASQKNRDAVIKTIQKELEKDRTKVYLVDVSPLGLVEMTRQNVSDGVREIMTVTCPTCDGEGRVLSEESVAIDAIRELRHHVKESKAEAFHVALHPNVAAIIIGPGGSKLRELEKETGKFFTLEGVEGASLELFEVRGEGSRDRIERAAVPVQEGQELRVSIAEPHMYAETDAIARLESGYVVVVAGAGPYVGEEHRVRLDRVTRTAAYATLLDAPPMIAVHVPPGDRESDILEPERRVGERVDIEGRVRRQRRRGSGESRKEPRQNGAAPVEPAALEDVELEDVSDDVVIALPSETVGDGAEEGTGKKRRRRRGGRGRRRGAAAESTDAAAAEGARVEPEHEIEAVAEEAEPDESEAEGAEAAAGESSSAKRRRRRRRRGGRGRGGVDAAAIGDEAREDAVDEPVEVIAVLSEAAPVEEPAPRPRSRRRKAAEPEVAAEAAAPIAEVEAEPAPRTRSRRKAAEPAAPVAEVETAPAPKPRTRRRTAAEPEAVAEPAAATAEPEPAKPRRSRKKAAEPAVAEAAAPIAEVAEVAPEPAKPRRSRRKAAEPEVAAEAVIEAPAPARPEPARPRRSRKQAAEPVVAPAEAAADTAAEVPAPAPRPRRGKAAEAEPAEPAAPAAAPRRRRTAAAAATADGAETAETPRPRSSRRRTAASEPVATADAPSGIGGLVSRVLGRRSRS